MGLTKEVLFKQYIYGYQKKMRRWVSFKGNLGGWGDRMTNFQRLSVLTTVTNLISKLLNIININTLFEGVSNLCELSPQSKG